MKLKTITILLLCFLVSITVLACAKKYEGGESSPTPAPSADASDNTKDKDTAEEEVYPENGLPKNEKVTLKMGFFEAGMGREYIDYALDTFKQKFPNVSFEVTYSPTVQTVVNTKISAGNDEDMFDMFNSSLPGGTPAITALVENGKLVDQEDLWDHKLYDGNGKTVRELMMEGTFETAGRILGKTYALPNTGTGAGLFYDKKLFEEHGWNQNPKTWSEFMELLETIKQAGIIPITYTGVHVTYINNAFGTWKLFELAENSGNLEKFEDDFRNYKLPQYLAPEYVDLWNRLYEMGKKGYFPEGVAALDHTQSQMQVLQHKAAMVSTGSWVENEMKDSTPEGFEWGYMVVPMGEDPAATKWTRLTSGNGFYIWEGKPELNKKWAKEFNVWMLNLDVQEVLGEKAGAIPLRKDFADDPARADKLQTLTKSILEYNKNNNTRGESGYRNVTLTDPAFAQASKVMNEAITAITSGKQDPQPILEEAEKLLEKAIQAQK
ncbi:extracellular solute-binding protein [Paenibacillus sp. J2TS4]|uniref:extracellular solute-binding protein n=1 Tax=Paenibacillus sp. J2TS4 TaxID=2807194 RepID=UPI001B2722E7|nr:extracellular solute-binding protein [Paenibacillus sp. J2TS4]GIP32644.1 hypothetical protein J2TS4_18540 [Paenibacillus sp. J2TS4]